MRNYDDSHDQPFPGMPVSAAEVARYLDSLEWRFLDRGRCSHGFITGPTDGTRAACNLSPSWFRGWMGTGNQAEYERCAALPRCKRCVTVLLERRWPS